MTKFTICKTSSESLRTTSEDNLQFFCEKTLFKKIKRVFDDLIDFAGVILNLDKPV